MVKFIVSILKRLKTMVFLVNTKYIHKYNVILNQTVTKLVTILTKYFLPYLNPTSYLNEDDTIHIVLLVNFKTPSYIKGYHEYQKIQTAFLQEELCGEMEPANSGDKYAVAIKKKMLQWGIYCWGVLVNLQRQYFPFFLKMNGVNAK